MEVRERGRVVLRMFQFGLKMNKEAESISHGQPDLGMEVVNVFPMII